MKDTTDREVVVEVTGLSKHFGNLKAVDSLTLDVYKGEVLGFLGPNGAGKTTSIHMICGLLQPDSGEIRFPNYPDGRQNSHKNRIGVCPQDNILWPKMTCNEQLVFMGTMYGMGLSPANERSRYLLNLLGLEDKQNTIAAKLSGGMKRRLNLCLALVHDPEILILDEPEAGLDPQSRILVREFIRELKLKKTVILTTHNMDEADRLSDRVAIIDNGKLLLVDTPSDLKKSIGEGDILEIQFGSTHPDNAETVVSNLRNICESVVLTNNVLIIKSKDLINLISQIIAITKDYGLPISEMKLRESTLEDVFIHLTGRKLRQ